MKKQEPLLTYVLIFITAGFYMFYWQYNAMKYLNEYFDDERFNPSRRLTNIIGILGVIFLYNEFILNRFIVSSDNVLGSILVIGGIFITFGWFFMIVENIRDIAKAVLVIETKMDIDSKINVNKATILFFIYYSTFYYIQKHINNIHIDKVVIE